jgi:hypothetical protein
MDARDVVEVEEQVVVAQKLWAYCLSIETLMVSSIEFEQGHASRQKSRSNPSLLESSAASVSQSASVGGPLMMYQAAMVCERAAGWE